MARKRLIKGANAARVEERIARVPADVMVLENGAESSIFDALRALEGAGRKAPAPSPLPAAPSTTRSARSPATKRAGKARTSKDSQARLRPEEPRVAPIPSPSGTAASGLSDPGQAPVKQGRLGPSDFSAAEREAIVRCCSDYKNRLPTYLMAVQREVRVIDSVIEKCRAAPNGAKRSAKGGGTST